MRWASLAIFFLALGLGDCLHWGRVEPAFGGNRRRGLFFPAGQSSRRGWCIGTSPFLNSLHTFVDKDRHVFVIAPSAPPPPLGVSVRECIFVAFTTFSETSAVVHARRGRQTAAGAQVVAQAHFN